MLTPTPGSKSREYGILRSFATISERDAFYQSAEFREWDERASHVTEGDAEYKELHGLEAWFRSPAKGAPPRWKMAIATLVGVYPTSLLLGKTIAPLASELPMPLQTMAVATCMVGLLIWIVMPLVTRALHRWLHG
ncbi:MAG: antibiotic biosynthesis monooxygenase [Xanthomonadales bacterium]|nr:antibiotic biosynthesis monooxygenase [Xanthomonadales bacterium]